MKHFVWLLFVPLLLAGCYLLDQKPRPFPDVEDIRQNKALYKQGVVLSLAIQAYMTGHDDNPPDPTKWIQLLSAVPYLPGGHFPANPWTTIHDVWSQEGIVQTSIVTVGSCPGLGTAYDDPTPIGTPLGRGVVPGNGLSTCHTYGTFLFSATRGGLRWVLYGIGRLHDQAIVRFVGTPGTRCCE